MEEVEGLRAFLRRPGEGSGKATPVQLVPRGRRGTRGGGGGAPPETSHYSGPHKECDHAAATGTHAIDYLTPRVERPTNTAAATSTRRLLKQEPGHLFEEDE
ncbi:hypothetical protein E2C01_094778 [Portunus trituberculatus]|uniref:Uncharacterized protein n=1 Tax=Portunus trituberculatus TaxID=210409 RepID=A0A5B7K2K7_PORTR|nr:hypothetical protein [Portunus trituberculatus]